MVGDSVKNTRHLAGRGRKGSTRHPGTYHTVATRQTTIKHTHERIGELSNAYRGVLQPQPASLHNNIISFYIPHSAGKHPYTVHTMSSTQYNMSS